MSDELANAAEDPANVFGKYVRVSHLGSGGMGEVWRAWDRDLLRWVALKFLRHTDPAEAARFKREAQTSAMLNHPGIAAVYEVGEHAGKPFIAMQYVQGRTLETFPRHDSKSLVDLVRQAALAVHFAHEQGVVHRDLKPANIMVEGTPSERHEMRDTGHGYRVFVMDFGLAKKTTVDSSVSLSGSIVGTPAYMAPEQARGSSRQIDRRGDVYSLGATLYELLADRPPFAGDGVYEILRKVLEEEPRPLRRIHPRIDADIETIVLKCLQKDPAHRYPSTLALAEDLRRYLQGEPILAHPPSVFYRLRKRLARRPTLVLLSSAAALAFAFGIAQIIRTRQRETRVYPVVERARETVRSAEAMLFRDQPSREAWLARLAEAQETCRDALRLHDAYAPAHLVLALIHRHRGDLDAALEALDRAVLHDPGYAQAHLERAKTWAEKIFEVEHSTPAGRHTELTTGREREWARQMREDLDRAAGTIEREERILARLLRLMLDGAADEAWREAERAAAAAEGDDRAWRVVGEALHRTRNYAKATEAYERYLRTWRGDAGGWRRYAHILNDASSGPEAALAAQRALRLNPDDALVPLELARAHHLQGDETAALDALGGAEDPLALLLRARVRRSVAAKHAIAGKLDQALEAWDKAVADCDEALRMRPDDDAILADRGVARRSKAFHLREAGRRQEAETEWAAARADLEAAVRGSPSANHLNDLGILLRERGDFEAALRLHERAIDLEPDHFPGHAGRARAHADRAESLAQAGRLAEALADCEASLRDHDKAIEIARACNVPGTPIIPIGPSLEELYNDRGSARLLAAGLLASAGRGAEALARWQAAVDDFDFIAANHPRSFKAFNNRGAARHARAEFLAATGRADDALREWDAALADLARAIEIRPHAWDPYNLRGSVHKLRADVLGRREDLDGALADFDEAVRRHPRSATLRSNRGFAKLSLEDRAGALADFDEALRLDPRCVEARLGRGNARIRSGDPDAAIEEYEAGIRVRPGSAILHYSLGNAWRIKRDIDRAIEFYTRAVELEATMASAFFNRGVCRHMKNDLQGALRDCRETVRLQPAHFKAYRRLGQIHEALGDANGAREAYESALRAAPEDWSSRAEVRAALERLRKGP